MAEETKESFTSSIFNKVFAPKYFTNSDMNNIFVSTEKHIYKINRQDENLELIYKNFDDYYNTYVSKLSDSPCKKYCNFMMEKKLVFLGTSINTRNSIIFCRTMISNDNKLSGVILDSNVLSINPITGETDAIDDCVYASYYGLLRAAILTNVKEITKDKDLHKYIIAYLNSLIIRTLEQKYTYTPKHKQLIMLACIYMFYRHYMSEKHQTCLSIIKKDYRDEFPSDFLLNTLPMMTNLTKHSEMKHIFNLLVDLHVVVDSPAMQLFKLIQLAQNNGFYCIVGPLDVFVPLIILSRYNTNLFDKKLQINDELQSNIENLIINYIKKINYSITT